MRTADTEIETDAGARNPAATRARPGLVAATGLALLYLAAGVRDHGLWSPTEPAFGGVVWNMAHGAGLAVPRVNEMAYLEKPPLAYWLALPGVHAFGLSAATLRLPSALLVLGALAALFLVARRLYDPAAAAVAVLAVGTMPSVWMVAHRATTDSAVVFFSFLAWAVFLDGLRVDDAPRGRSRHEALLAATLAVSFLAKNLFVPFVVLVPVAATLAALGRVRQLVRTSAWFALFLLLVAAPWAFFLHAEGGWTFVRVALLDNTVGRFLDLGHAAQVDGTLLNDATIVNRKGPLFYVPYLLLTSLPWSALVLPSGWTAARRFRGSPVRTFLAFGFPALFVALSLSSSKADEYFLPAAFFFGLAAAEWTSAEEHLEQRRATFLLGHARVVCALLAAGAAVLAARTGGALPLLGAAAVALALLLASLRLAPSWRSAPLALALVAVAETAVAGALVPSLDRQKSPAPFFAELAPELEGRRVVTDVRDDLHLPLLNWFLDRRVEVLPSQGAVVAALRGPRPVAAVVLSSSPIASGRFPAANDFRRVQAVEGKRPLVALLNDPPPAP